MSRQEDIDFSNQIKKEYGERLKENIKGIDESAVFMSMLNGHFDDPLMLMQFSLAIFMDKPIMLVVNKGTRVPANVAKVATAIEYVDYEDPEEVAKAVKKMTDEFDGE